MIKGTLLIRESDFQYFLANNLYKKKIIDSVIIEKEVHYIPTSKSHLKNYF